MILEWLTPLLEWTGLSIIPFLLLVIAVCSIIKIIKD